jgi:hypothetical protein
VDDAAAELGDALERRGDVVDLEVGQRERVPGPAAAFVHADGRCAGAGLPARALPLAALLELGFQQAAPEAQRALRVVGRELDQLEPRFAHRRDDTPAAEIGHPEG